MKKSLACLLACLMTAGTMAFGACDGQEIYESVMSGLNSGSSESSGSSDDSGMLDGSSQSGMEDDSQSNSMENDSSSDSAEDGSSSDKNLVDEEALAALQAAIEKTLEKENNYQSRQMSTSTHKGMINGEQRYCYYLEQDIITKIDGNKEEEIWSEKSRYLPDGEWSFQDRHWIYEYIEENSGNGYWYEDGEWTKGWFSSGEIDAEATSEIVKLYQQLSEYLKYDKTTGIYYIEDLTLDITGLMGEIEGLKNGVATATYHRLEIELKDGYIYRLYSDMEQYMKDASTEDDVEQVYEMHITSEVTEYYTDWGETVVTLPEIAEE